MIEVIRYIGPTGAYVDAKVIKTETGYMAEFDYLGELRTVSGQTPEDVYAGFRRLIGQIENWV